MELKVLFCQKSSLPIRPQATNATDLAVTSFAGMDRRSKGFKGLKDEPEPEPEVAGADETEGNSTEDELHWTGVNTSALDNMGEGLADAGENILNGTVG
jgi:hypothetical protein